MVELPRTLAQPQNHGNASGNDGIADKNQKPIDNMTAEHAADFGPTPRPYRKKQPIFRYGIRDLCCAICKTPLSFVLPKELRDDKNVCSENCFAFHTYKN